MNAFEQIKEGLSQAWVALSEGWRHLIEYAGDAVTRFSPGSQDNDLGDSSKSNTGSRVRFGFLPVEVVDRGDDLVVTLELPGLEAHEIGIEAHERYLVISGEKRYEHEDRRGRYVVTERAYGRFERSISLPCEVRSGDADAHYKNGVLRLVLQKQSPSSGRRISVRPG